MEQASVQNATEPPQASPLDTGLISLVMLARFHNIAASPEQLHHEFTPEGALFGKSELLLAVAKLGL